MMAGSSRSTAAKVVATSRGRKADDDGSGFCFEVEIRRRKNRSEKGTRLLLLFCFI